MSDAIDVKRKPGRPPTGHVFVGLRFPPDEIAAVDARAEASGESRSETIRALVRTALEPKRRAR